jgi:ribosomal protein L22
MPHAVPGLQVRRVLDQIRGRSYEEAIMMLEYMPYKVGGWPRQGATGAGGSRLWPWQGQQTVQVQVDSCPYTVVQVDSCPYTVDEVDKQGLVLSSLARCLREPAISWAGCKCSALHAPRTTPNTLHHRWLRSSPPSLLQHCEPVLKLLLSAAANAKQNLGLRKAKLVVSECFADAGPVLKRAQPRAQVRLGERCFCGGRVCTWACFCYCAVKALRSLDV